jgi:glycosyltransferase involved in cell wall biosynthesis
MLAGRPVICADGPGAARVVTNLAHRFAPNDAVATSTALADALTTETGTGRVGQAVASWDAVVARTVAVYERATASPVRRRRPTIAFVSPLPPEASGVATYSRALVEALARRCHVTCFVPDDVTDERRPVGTTIATGASLAAEAAHGRFDEVVYALGNHPRHGIELALLRAVPGAVELHDVRLVGAYAGLHAPGDALADELARLYPDRYERDVLRSPELTMEPAVQAGVWMAAEVAALATTVLTHSQHASDLVEADTGVDALDIGPLAVPTLAWTPTTSNVERIASTPGQQTADQLLVSAGVVHPSKRPELLIEALAVLTRTHPHAALVLVGPVDAAYRRELCVLADRFDVGSRVIITGRVTSDAYDANLRRASIAVQLRAHSNGESSAAVDDCLARGLPTVVTCSGASAELPGEVVWFVDAEVEPSVLAATLASLLDDPVRREALSVAATAYAAANTFDAAADRVLTALFGPGRC